MLLKVSLKLKLAILLGLVYLFISVVTLPHYGINWDTINHLPRGQAYLNYYFTGNTDYSNLPKFEVYKQDEYSLLYKPDKKNLSRRSIYQNDSSTYEYYIEHDGNGHPPTSDILSSYFNYIFFQKLGIVNDIDSYRIYSILLSSILVAFIFWWVATEYNIFSGLISYLTLATYPLFFAESHFNNEKDIPQTVFYTFFLYFASTAFIKKKPRLILFSGVFFGLALGTKFNILFAGFTFLIWLSLYLSNQILRKAYLKYYLFGSISIMIGFSIFYLTWPWLWQDPLGHILQIFNFYSDIGTATSEELSNRFNTIHGVNLYPITWIISTTPLIVLLLFCYSIFYFNRLKSDKKLYILCLIWLIVTIARVSVPGANIYGGVRQIMEFIVPLSMLAGIAVSEIGKTKLIKHLVVAAFLVNILALVNYHPYENTYQNIIGRYAYLESEGNTYGSIYREAAAWLNENAKPNSIVVTVDSIPANIPSVWLREDINFANQGNYYIVLHSITNNFKSSEYILEYRVSRGSTALMSIWKDPHFSDN